MGAVSNVTTLSDTSTVNKILSRRAAPEFKKHVAFINLIYTEDLPGKVGTATKGFRREGALTVSSAALAEATADSLGTPRADDEVDATAAKAVRSDGVSIENLKFAIVEMSSYVRSQARAIGRAVDDQGLDLLPTITNEVDASGDLTVDNLDEAQLLIVESECPDMNRDLIFMGTPRAMRNLKSDIRNNSGSAYTSERFLSIFNGPPAANGYYGDLPGMKLFYVQTGFTAVGAQSSQALFHPDWAFAGMFDRQVSVWTDKIGKGGLYYELVSYFFWAIVLWNPGAACEVLSSS